jgi:hypothetical protein
LTYIIIVLLIIGTRDESLRLILVFFTNIIS